jgi:hypothetical protein
VRKKIEPDFFIIGAPKAELAGQPESEMELHQEGRPFHMPAQTH